jgi:hypothetical protein
MADLNRIGVYLYPHQLEWLRRQQKPGQPWKPLIPASEIIRDLIDQAMAQQR